MIRMQKQLIPPCRLLVLFARRTSRAVIFRRGPSKWTQLILWDTKTDEFAYGQWFKGRIYVRRCDLSPDGTKLVYFVSKINQRTLSDPTYTYAWTAVSKPPYLTALALWPKGDCWHGGGLFLDDTTLLLNHRPERALPHPHHCPQGLTIQPNPNAQGEDDPLYSDRLTRDGWCVQQAWQVSYTGYPGFFVTYQPEIRTRRHPTNKYCIHLTRTLNNLHYHEAFSVTTPTGQRVVDTEQVTWADWDQRGRLILLQDGKLLIGSEDIAGQSFHVRELADFNAQTPAAVTAPAWATRW